MRCTRVDLVPIVNKPGHELEVPCSGRYDEETDTLIEMCFRDCEFKESLHEHRRSNGRGPYPPKESP